jgi:hypothetical protein
MKSSSVRRRARAATGPVTELGKKIVSQNALLHGLSVSKRSDPKLTAEIEERVRLLVGSAATAIRIVAAEQIAAAEIDVDRINEARHHLYIQAFALECKPVEDRRDEIRMRASSYGRLGGLWGAFQRLILKDPHATKHYLNLLQESELEPEIDLSFLDDDKVKPPENPDSKRVRSIEWLMPRLRGLDRYSKRANARYRRAMEIWRLVNLHSEDHDPPPPDAVGRSAASHVCLSPAVNFAEITSRLEH